MIIRVYNILQELGLPLAFLKRPDFGTENIAISYHFFSEGDLLFGDGKVKESGGALQVDVFSNGVDYTSIVSDIIIRLKNANFMYADGHDSIENLQGSEQIYHKVLIFNYVESEVIKCQQ